MSAPLITLPTVIPGITSGHNWPDDGSTALSQLSQAFSDVNDLAVWWNANGIGEGVESDWAFEIKDSSSNASSTTVTAKVVETGGMIFMSAANITNIDTMGMTGTDVLRISLPTQNATQNFGLATMPVFENLASVQGTGSTLITRPIPGGTDAFILNVDPLGDAEFLTVQDINSGTTDLLHYSIAYRKLIS